jgi:hypothetical protein
VSRQAGFDQRGRDCSREWEDGTSAAVLDSPSSLGIIVSDRDTYMGGFSRSGFPVALQV